MDETADGRARKESNSTTPSEIDGDRPPGTTHGPGSPPGRRRMQPSGAPGRALSRPPCTPRSDTHAGAHAPRGGAGPGAGMAPAGPPPPRAPWRDVHQQQQEEAPRAAAVYSTDDRPGRRAEATGRPGRGFLRVRAPVALRERVGEPPDGSWNGRPSKNKAPPSGRALRRVPDPEGRPPRRIDARRRAKNKWFAENLVTRERPADGKRRLRARRPGGESWGVVADRRG